MAYFSNGTEGMCYTEKYCDHCINWRDKKDGRGHGCPVMDAHVLWAYEECNSQSNAKQMLDMFIPMNKETHFADECAMFHPNVRMSEGADK